jgi:hypothetical protein
MPHIDPTFSQLAGSLATFVVVILAWLHSNARINDTITRFDKRLDDMSEFISAENELTRAGIRRVEEVMDARLKHSKTSAA